MQVIEFARRLDAKIAAERPEFAKFPVNFPVSREFERGDRFEWDCVRHHAVSGETLFCDAETRAPRCDGRPSISCCRDHSEWQVGETGNAHAVREPAIDGGFDEIG